MKDYKENMKAPIYYQSDCNLALLDGKSATAARVTLTRSTSRRAAAT